MTKKAYIQNLVALLISEDKSISVGTAIRIAKQTADALEAQGYGW